MTTADNYFSLQRRKLLLGMAAGAGSLLMPNIWAQQTAAKNTGRLIVVFLRGAYDGLSATIPYKDAEYYRQRPTIAILPSDGEKHTAITLDKTFALHPALAPLLPLWRDGVMTFIPACGSPDPTRSHFEAQTHWEIGIPGKSNAPCGWLNTLAKITGGEQKSVAIGVGDANPKILSGSAPVQLIPNGDAAVTQGALANNKTRQALLDLYNGDKQLSNAFIQGSNSRMSSANQLSAEIDTENSTAHNTLTATGLPLDAKHLGILMRNNRNLRLGFISAGGWDTHANQGAATGNLAKNFANLAAALVQLRTDFSEPDDIIAVVSEFGRTCAENGTRGTDHGHGNTLWLIGNRIAGGRWHGTWSGLSTSNLYDGRDLPVHHDFRSIFALILRSSFGLRDSELQEVFPGANFTRDLEGIIKAA